MLGRFIFIGAAVRVYIVNQCCNFCFFIPLVFSGRTFIRIFLVRRGSLGSFFTIVLNVPFISGLFLGIRVFTRFRGLFLIVGGGFLVRICTVAFNVSFFGGLFLGVRVFTRLRSPFLTVGVGFFGRICTVVLNVLLIVPLIGSLFQGV